MRDNESGNKNRREKNKIRKKTKKVRLIKINKFNLKKKVRLNKR